MTLEDLIATRVVAASTLEDAARVLEGLLSGGFSISQEGDLCLTRGLVERVHGLRIEIYPNEHPPPHFHVRAPGLSATFAITDGAHLCGSIRPDQLRLVHWWYRRSRPLLVRTWNATRPSDCTVGPVADETSG
ncbi:MAG: DUF4160 domain-containing protein [Pseudomonadota bacterium]|jgi:hypothetical protein